MKESLQEPKDHEEDQPILQIPVKGTVWVLVGIAVLLVIVSVIGQIISHLTNYDLAFGLIPLVYVNSELSIPTVFSTLLLFICAILLVIITVVKTQRKDAFRKYWGVLSAGFLFMTFDEGSSIHELLDDPMRRFFGNQNPGLFHFAWVVPGIILIAVLGIFFIKFFLHLPKKTRTNFILAAVLYIGGAVGVEMIGGQYASAHGSDNLVSA